ncbi:MAG: zinc-binding dehydrogenase [Thermoleophilaceae bacterium]|nr:zinc-binding dehydrogenase [Thermoleophilaceae bacterium]
MKAVLIDGEGAAPRVGDAPDPEGGDVVRVVAGSLNPIDVSTAAGRYPIKPSEFPYVAGKEGTGERADGSLVYFTTGGGHGPGGSFAERTVAGESFELPDGTDPARAAGLGIAGIAGWLAVEWRGEIRAGERVLVLGASGVVGQVAVQAARALEAGAVVAAGRNKEAMRELGANAVVGLGSADEIRCAFGGHGPDLVIDPLWGVPATAAIDAAAPGARIVQLGQSAGPAAELASGPIRSKGLEIRGHTNFAVPPEVREAAYRRCLEEVTIEVERIPLDGVRGAWRRQEASPGGRKLVLVP